jgi:hypothetical protein
MLPLDDLAVPKGTRVTSDYSGESVVPCPSFLTSCWLNFLGLTLEYIKPGFI